MLAAAIGKLPTPDHIQDVWQQVIKTISHVRDGGILARFFDIVYIVGPLYLWNVHQQGLLAWRLIPVVTSVEVVEDDPMEEHE